MDRKDITKKRGPGRPPRRILPPLATKGIVDTPEFDDNIIEFCYYDPMLFKHLFCLFKNLKVRDIYMIFSKDKFYFLTKDHTGNRILVPIDCSKVLHYYCGAETRLCLSVNKDNIQSIFLNLNKNIQRITIAYEHSDDMLQIRLDNNNIGKIETRNVLVNIRDIDDELSSVLNEINNDKHVLSFSLPAKEFKELICSVCSYGDKFKIEKHGHGPLTISFSRTHTNNCTDEFTDSDKISLFHNLTEKQTFTCQLYAILLKSIAGSIVNSKVMLKCFNDNIAIISSTITDICDVYIIAENNE